MENDALINIESLLTEAWTETELEPAVVAQKLTQSAWQVKDTVISTKSLLALLLILLLLVMIRVVDLFAALIRKRTKSALAGYTAGFIKGIAAAVTFFRIAILYGFMDGIASTILMSSSLLVAVMGFVFQEGLTNIVHGFILSVSMPFRIGDRVTAIIDGVSITGYVKEMSLRSTTIQSVENNAYIIIPNAKMDLGMIQDNDTDRSKSCTSGVELRISYESDLNHAISVIQDCIAANPLVRAERERTRQKDAPAVFVLDFSPAGIVLKGILITRTVEENFTACSDVRREIKKRFDADEKVNFAYPFRMEILRWEKRQRSSR